VLHACFRKSLLEEREDDIKKRSRGDETEAADESGVCEEAIHAGHTGGAVTGRNEVRVEV
jgi:hypothetical protein